MVFGGEFAGGCQGCRFTEDLDSGMILEEAMKIESVDFAIVDDEGLHGLVEFSEMVTVNAAPPVGRLVEWIFPWRSSRLV